MSVRDASAQRANQTACREMALADAVKEVASELRMVDAVDLVTFARTENHPNIGDLVNSAAELYFAEGALTYGWAAEAELRWAGTPAVKLDLEFRHGPVTAFFRLVLEASRAGVDLHYIAFDEASADPAVNTGRLVEAIHDARRLPVAAAA